MQNRGLAGRTFSSVEQGFSGSLYESVDLDAFRERFRSSIEDWTRYTAMSNDGETTSSDISEVDEILKPEHGELIA